MLYWIVAVIRNAKEAPEVQSVEAQIQMEREANVLATFYPNVSHIPLSAEEPLSETVEIAATPAIIPLEETVRFLFT